MKAIVQDRFGAPDVLELRDIDQPEPREREVLVRVRAASVNPADWYAMVGSPWVARLQLGSASRRPAEWAWTWRAANNQDLAFLQELLAAGTVTPVVERSYPLRQAADALRRLGEGHAQGKLVITV
jgi:NADPH:quinone reductase-like Zn-dependent oxidoreductase